MKIYYSRWIGSYSTEMDNRILGYIIDRFNLSRDDVLDPSRYRHGEHKMEYYLSKVDDADILVYYELAPGIISAGVAKEIRHALRKGKKVYKVTLEKKPRLMEVKEIREEALTVNETRYINEVALQYKIPIEKITGKYLEIRKRYRELANREALILATAELIEEESEGLITVKYILKRKLPKQYKIDTRKLMAKIGLIKLDKRGRRIYTEEERIKAVKLAEKHGNIKIAAKILGIPESTLRKWIYKKKIISKREYPRYTPMQYKEAMKLLNEGYSIRQVAKILGIPESRVKSWKIYKRRPPRAKLELKPSTALAYMIGTLLSDGSVTEKKGYIYSIQLKVVDREYAEEFSKCAHQVLKKSYTEPKLLKDGRWEVRYYSSAFYYWWKKQTLKTLGKYIEHNKETMKAFIRGFMDGEASSSSSSISVSNTDLELLKYLKILLNRLGIRTGKIKKRIEKGQEVIIKGKRYKANKPVYALYVNKKDYLSNIGFTVKRKNR